MAFLATSFQRIGGGVGGLFLYNTPDAQTVFGASGYFNSVTSQLKQWDIIICVGVTGGTPTVDVTFVTSATGAATVTTSALEGLTTS